MNAATLSIVIPTFNRNEKLANLIRSYQSFLPDNASVLLIDDCSPTPIADTLQAEGLIPDNRVTIIRNPVNVGLAANIIECFKQCATEWMWLMSDDDFVSRRSLYANYRCTADRFGRLHICKLQLVSLFP